MNLHTPLNNPLQIMIPIPKILHRPRFLAKYSVTLYNCSLCTSLIKRFTLVTSSGCLLFVTMASREVIFDAALGMRPSCHITFIIMNYYEVYLLFFYFY